MKVLVHDDGDALGAAAADQGRLAIAEAIERSGRANIIVATGASRVVTDSAVVGSGRPASQPGTRWGRRGPPSSARHPMPPHYWHAPCQCRVVGGFRR